jgi:hypothetical protein
VTYPHRNPRYGESPIVVPKYAAGEAYVSPLIFTINTEKKNSGQNSEQFETERIKNSGKIFFDTIKLNSENFYKKL